MSYEIIHRINFSNSYSFADIFRPHTLLTIFGIFMYKFKDTGIKWMHHTNTQDYADNFDTIVIETVHHKLLYISHMSKIPTC